MNTDHVLTVKRQQLTLDFPLSSTLPCSDFRANLSLSKGSVNGLSSGWFHLNPPQRLEMHLAEGVNRQQYSEVNQFFTSRWKRKNLENGENTLSRKIPFLFQSSYFQIGQRQVGMSVCKFYKALRKE